MAPHSSTLAWKIPWTEEPGRLQSMGSLRVGHHWATSLSLFTFMHWRRKWQPLQCSCLENPRDGGAWWAAVYGVTQSRKRLKDLAVVHASKVMLKNLQMFKLDLEKAEEPEIKLPTVVGSWRKQGNSRKTSTSASVTMPKPLTVWITTNCEKFLKRWE